MRKSIKLSLIAIVVVLSVLLLDTLQAMILNNSPLLKIREDYNGGTLFYVDKGVVVDLYQCTNGERNVVFKWNTYLCLDK